MIENSGKKKKTTLPMANLMLTTVMQSNIKHINSWEYELKIQFTGRLYHIFLT